MRQAHRSALKRARSRAALAGALCPPQCARAFVHRSLSLAAAIAARYAALERRWPALALVLRELKEPGVSIRMTRLAEHSSIFLNPRLLLSMAVTHRRELHELVERSAPSRTSDEPPSARPIFRETKQAAPARTGVIERILWRTLREERPSKATGIPAADRGARMLAAVPHPVAPAPSPSPSGMVVRRTQRPSEGQPAAGEKAKAELERPAAGIARNVPAAAPTPAEITRITDQVLQVLDRRIVAQRERMGRV
jgi:hypothetical protein